jgi:hypothetical protein
VANAAAPYAPKQQRERRLLAEWLALRYPDARIQQQVRLGAYQPTIATKDLDRSELKALGVWRRYADAIVFHHTALILIEASIPADVGYVSRLHLYRRLIPLTPELAEFVTLPVVMLYLCAIEDPVVTAMAREAGIRVEVHQPPWVADFIGTLERNKQRPPKSGGL